MDVPCLKDGSTSWGGLREPDSAIVIYVSDGVGPQGLLTAVLPVVFKTDHDPVSYLVLVRNPVGIFTSIVLKDKLLLTFLNILPVCLEQYVEEGIMSEDKLGGRSTHGSMYQ